jgi:predicted NAD/FAD-binding protein
MLDVNQPVHGLLVLAKQPTLAVITGPLANQIIKLYA